MMAQGQRFVPGEVQAWMDCGNKAITVATNTKMLHFLAEEGKALVHPSVQLNNATIVPPCFVGEGVVLTNATVGPGVSIGPGSSLTQVTIEDSIVQAHSHIENAQLYGAMIGNNVRYNGKHRSISLGDYSELI